MNRYRSLPEIVVGYPLEIDTGWFRIIRARAGQNLFINPSVEVNTNTYAGNNATIARSTTWQYRGAYSLATTPTLGMGNNCGIRNSQGPILTLGRTYTVSCYFRGIGGVLYWLGESDTAAAAFVNRTYLVATGRDQRISVTFTEPTGIARHFWLFRDTSSSDLNIFYADAWQLEENTLTTYIDGDELGLVYTVPAAYLWDGLPHASTSRRSGQTRAGGELVNLRDLGFILTGIIGLGMPDPEIAGLEYATLDGGVFQNNRLPTVDFTLAGRIMARSRHERDRYVRQIEDLVNPQSVTPRQPLVLYYLPDDCEEIEDEKVITAVYTGGLSGVTDNRHGVNIGLHLKRYLPYISAGGSTAVLLTTRTSVASTGITIVARDKTGLWSNIGTVTGSDLSDLAVGPDGKWYMVGIFTSINGVSMTNIGRYNPVSKVWEDIGGLGGAGETIVLGPDGKLYIGFNGTTVDGGTVTANRIASYDVLTDTWAQVADGLNGMVRGIAFAPDTTMVVAGEFTTNAAGTTTLNWATKLAYGDTTFDQMTSGAQPGLNNTTYAVVADASYAYYFGQFLFTADGSTVTLTRAGRWDLVNGGWSAMGTGGLDNLAVDAELLNGHVIAIGSQLTSGGQSTRFIGDWNGSQWAALGGGLGTATASNGALSVSLDGRLYIFSDGSIDITEPTGATVWTGSQYIPAIDFDPPGATDPNPGMVTRANELIMAYESTGTGYGSGITTVSNTGQAEVGPVVKVKNSSTTTAFQFFQLNNITTGAEFYFDGLNVLPGETLTLDFSAVTFLSDFRGDVSRFIIPSSDKATWKLQPGDNLVSLFVNGADITATMTWREQYLSIHE